MFHGSAFLDDVCSLEEENPSILKGHILETKPPTEEPPSKKQKTTSASLPDADELAVHYSTFSLKTQEVKLYDYTSEAEDSLDETGNVTSASKSTEKASVVSKFTPKLKFSGPLIMHLYNIFNSTNFNRIK